MGLFSVLSCLVPLPSGGSPGSCHPIFPWGPSAASRGCQGSPSPARADNCDSDISEMLSPSLCSLGRLSDPALPCEDVEKYRSSVSSMPPCPPACHSQSQLTPAPPSPNLCVRAPAHSGELSSLQTLCHAQTLCRAAKTHPQGKPLALIPFLPCLSPPCSRGDMSRLAPSALCGPDPFTLQCNHPEGHCPIFLYGMGASFTCPR